MDHRPILGSKPTLPVMWRKQALWIYVVTGLSFVVFWGSDFRPLAWLHAHLSLSSAAATNRTRLHPPVSVAQPTPLGTDSSVSVVPLRLHLVATRLGPNNREGFADIGVDVRTPQTYRAGAILANGARIDEIYSNYVILTREGREERLYVEGQTPPGDSPTGPRPSARS